jgi:hypothetical protein
MPRRKTAKKQRYGSWNKALKGLRKRYEAKPTENTIHGGATIRPSFHLKTVTVKGRQKAHPVPSTSRRGTTKGKKRSYDVYVLQRG